MSRWLIHLDADAFFASVEQAADPRLRGKPVAVGGEKRGIIAAASYEARRYGIHTPMPTARARRLCPNLILLPGDFEKYERFSRWMFSYAYDFTPDVEITSIDEGYLDLTAARRPAADIARVIRRAIGQSLKITVSEGIGTNKLVSQIASKLNKPAAFAEIPAGRELAFLHPLPNHWLPGVGPHTASRLNAAGLARVGQIAVTPPEMLQLLLGRWAVTLREFANGIDDRPIVPVSAPAQSYGHQETFARDQTDEVFLEATLRRMADSLMAKVRADGKSVRTLTVKVRYNDMDEDQCSESLSEPTDLESDLYPRLRPMLCHAWKRRVSLRLVSLRLSNVYHGFLRAELPLEQRAQQHDTRRRLAGVVDELRHQRGRYVIMRGHDLLLRDQPVPQEDEKESNASSKTPLPSSTVIESSPDSSSSPRTPDSGLRTPAPPSALCKPRRTHRPPPTAHRPPSTALPLSMHSYYSFLDSTLSIDAIIGLAARHKLPAIALTDRGNLHGAVEFTQKAQAAGIRPILGAELCVQGRPLWLYVQNAEGYTNLCRGLSALSNEEKRTTNTGSKHQAPRSKRQINTKRQDSNIRETPNAERPAARDGAALGFEDWNLSGAWNLDLGVWNRAFPDTSGLLAVSPDTTLASLFPGRFYLAAGSPDDLKHLDGSGALPCVAVLPVHYAAPGDRWKFDIVQSIRTLTLLRQEHPEKRLRGEYHFRAPQEMTALFRNHPGVLERIAEIAERCRFVMPFQSPQFPAFHPPDGSTPRAFLRKLVFEGFVRRYGKEASSNHDASPGSVSDPLSPRGTSGERGPFPTHPLEHEIQNAKFLSVASPLPVPTAVDLSIKEGQKEEITPSPPSDGEEGRPVSPKLGGGGGGEEESTPNSIPCSPRPPDPHRRSGLRKEGNAVTDPRPPTSDSCLLTSDLRPLTPAPGPLTPDLRAQIEEELRIIHEVGYEEYFLVVWNILRQCRRHGIEWITRGSAADSLVCYCLGISDVCPIRFGLYFRRFLNKERMSMHKLPDIDVDFPHDRKDDVVDLVLHMYGNEHAAVVGGFSTFQARSAFAEIAKVLGVAERDVRKFTEHFPWRIPGSEGGDQRSAVSGQRAEGGGQGAEGSSAFRTSDCTLAAALRASPDCGDLPLDEEPYRGALEMAAFLDGFPRYPKMHPCGVVLSRQPMHALTPTFVSNKGYPATHFDMDAVEAIGLVKIDILAQGGLAAMRDVRAMLRERGAEVDLTRFRLSPVKNIGQPSSGNPSPADPSLSLIPHSAPRIPHCDDPGVWDMISSGGARAVHHIESPAMVGLCRMCHVGDIDGLIAIVSVIRPGAANELKKVDFARRYQGLEPSTYPHPSLEPFLKSTFGMVVYEEHILQICEAFAGLPQGRADTLRRALVKQDWSTIVVLEREFKDAARQHHHDRAVIDKVWNLVEGFVGYAFCKAHSTAYGVEAYQSAWLKRYFPAEFMAAVLTNGKGFYDPLVYVLECHRLGIGILPPWVNEPGPAFNVVRQAVDKPQTPNAKRRTNTKHQDPSSREPPNFNNQPDAGPAPGLELGAWDLSGSWILDLGVSSEGVSSEDVVPARTAAIRVPATRVQGLTERTKKRLVEERARGAFVSLRDFYRRVGPLPEELEALLRAGAFDEFGPTRTALFWEVQYLRHAYGHHQRHGQPAQGWLIPPPDFGGGGLPSLPVTAASRRESRSPSHDAPGQPAAALTEPTRRQRLEWEQELLGFTVSDHPLALHDDVAWETYCPVARLGEHVGQRVVTCGLVIEQRIHHQATGEPMKFLTLADWTGMVETELFAATYRSYGLATVRYPVLEISATVEPFENGRGFTLRVHRAGRPRRRRTASSTAKDRSGGLDSRARKRHLDNTLSFLPKN